MHEMGHVLGLDHAETGLMADTLGVGVRRVPTFDTSWLDELLASPRARRRALEAAFADR